MPAPPRTQVSGEASHTQLTHTRMARASTSAHRRTRRQYVSRAHAVQPGEAKRASGGLGQRTRTFHTRQRARPPHTRATQESRCPHHGELRAACVPRFQQRACAGIRASGQKPCQREPPQRSMQPPRLEPPQSLAACTREHQAVLSAEDASGHAGANTAASWAAITTQVCTAKSHACASACMGNEQGRQRTGRAATATPIRRTRSSRQPLPLRRNAKRTRATWKAARRRH